MLYLIVYSNMRVRIWIHQRTKEKLAVYSAVAVNQQIADNLGVDCKGGCHAMSSRVR